MALNKLNWYADRHKLADGSRMVACQDTGATVAVCYAVDGFEYANLVAAAPSLLEACELALTELREPEHADTLRKLIEAINTAKGL